MFNAGKWFVITSIFVCSCMFLITNAIAGETGNSFKNNSDDYSTKRSSSLPVGLTDTFNAYKTLSTYKAFAIAVNSYGDSVAGWSYEYGSQLNANTAALRSCENSRITYKISAVCTVYAEGNAVINLIPETTTADTASDSSALQICSYDSNTGISSDCTEFSPANEILTTLDANLNLFIPTLSYNDGVQTMHFEVGDLYFFPFQENNKSKLGFKVNDYRLLNAPEIANPAFMTKDLKVHIPKLEYVSSTGNKRFLWANMLFRENQEFGPFFEVLDYGEAGAETTQVYTDENTEIPFLSYEPSGHVVIPDFRDGILLSLQIIHPDGTYLTNHYDTSGNIEKSVLSDGSSLLYKNCINSICDIIFSNQDQESIIYNFNILDGSYYAGLMSVFKPVQRLNNLKRFSPLEFVIVVGVITSVAYYFLRMSNNNIFEKLDEAYNTPPVVWCKAYFLSHTVCDKFAG